MLIRKSGLVFNKRNSVAFQLRLSARRQLL